VKVTALCDVDNPLLGPDGAARVFGPQKGADESAVDLLERGLENLVRVVRRDLRLGWDPGSLPGGGAAGGLGAALATFLGAELVSGIDFVMRAAGLPERIAWSDLVVTGEGQLDGQSRRGKACAGVAREAGRAGRPVVVLTGSVRGEDEALAVLGLDAVLPVVPGPMGLVQAMDRAAVHVEAAAARLARLLVVGSRLGPGGGLGPGSF
jgi:glycerate kinase